MNQKKVIRLDKSSHYKLVKFFIVSCKKAEWNYSTFFGENGYTMITPSLPSISSPIMAVCMVWMGGWNVAVATIVANLIGGCIFFWVDKWIFGDKKVKKWVAKDNEELAPAIATVDGEE